MGLFVCLFVYFVGWLVGVVFVANLVLGIEAACWLSFSVCSSVRLFVCLVGWLVGWLVLLPT